MNKYEVKINGLPEYFGEQGEAIFPVEYDSKLRDVSIKVTAGPGFKDALEKWEKDTKSTLQAEVDSKRFNDLLSLLPKETFDSLGERFLEFRGLKGKGVSFQDGMITLKGVPVATKSMEMGGKSRNALWDLHIDLYTLLGFLKSHDTPPMPSRDPNEVRQVISVIRKLGPDFKPIGDAPKKLEKGTTPKKSPLKKKAKKKSSK